MIDGTFPSITPLLNPVLFPNVIANNRKHLLNVITGSAGKQMQSQSGNCQLESFIQARLRSTQRNNRSHRLGCGHFLLSKALDLPRSSFLA